MKTLALLTLVSIMAFRTEGGNLRLSLWDGDGLRSAIIVKDSQPYRWFRSHVSRDSVGTFGHADAETVRVEFTGDTVTEVR